MLLILDITKPNKCENCGVDCYTPLDKMKKEFKKNFPNSTEDEQVILCDDCYNKALEEINKLTEIEKD